MRKPKNQQKEVTEMPQEEVTEVIEEVVPVKKPLSTIQKIKLSHNLITIFEDESIKKIFLTKDGGQYAYDIFCTAVESEVERLTTGEQLERELADATAQVKEIVNNCAELQNHLVSAVQQVLGRKIQPPQQTIPGTPPAPPGAIRGRRQPTYVDDEQAQPSGGVPEVVYF
jgi:hypothetical protein